MGTNKEVAEIWIRYAEIDLQAANVLFQNQRELITVAFYHAHQAAEKAIKAILIIEEIKFPKTHDLNKLVSLLEAQQPVNSALYNLITAFEDFNPEICYPDEPLSLSQKHLTGAVDAAIKLIEVAKKHIHGK